MPDWLVATAENGRQRLAQASCAENGFDTYFPLLRERRMFRGKKQFVTGYLFGRYFFVSFLPQWFALRSTRGIGDIFMRDEQPALVHDEIINEIKAREDRDGVITIRRGFKKGQHVQVKSGVFKGLLGSFESLTTGDREAVFLSMLGRIVRVELAAGSLAAVL